MWLFWIAVIVWAAYDGGRLWREDWRDLAARFPAGARPAKPSFVVQRLRLEGALQEHGVRIVPTEAGLHLYERFGRRVPALFIPWSAIREARGGLWVPLFNPRLRLLVEGQPTLRIELGPRAARAVAPFVRAGAG